MAPRNKVEVEITAKDTGAAKAFAEAGQRAEAFGKQVAGVTGGVGGLDGALGTVGARLGGIGTALGAGSAGVATFAVAVAGMATAVATMAADVDLAMRRVGIAIGATGDQATAMRAQVAAFSTEFGLSQLDVARVMKTVADNGPASVEGLRAMTRAALELAAVTGGDANSIAQGLDGVIDAFGRSNNEAQQIAATIFGITKGTIPLEDLFATIDKVGAAAHAAGLSLEDMVGAATAMRDANIPIKQIKAALEELVNAGDAGVQRIRDLAGGARDAAADSRDLARALANVQESTEQASKRIHEELNAALMQLGNAILPTVNAALERYLDFIQRIKAAGPLRTVASAVFGSPLPEAPGHSPLDTDPTLAKQFAPAAAPTPAQDPIAKRFLAIQKATADLATVSKAQVRAFINELDALAKKADGVELGNKIVGLSGKLTADLPKAGTAIVAAAKRAQDALSTFLQEAARITAEAAGDEISAVDQKISRLAADAKKAGGAQTPEFLAAVAALKDQRQALVAARETADAVASSTHDVNDALRDTLARVHEITTQTPNGLDLVDETDLADLVAFETELSRIVAIATSGDIAKSGLIDAAKLEEAKRTLEQMRTVLDGFAPTTRKPSTITPDAKHAKNWADEIARGGRALIDAASAAGLLDAKLATALNSAVNLATSLSSAIKSKGADVGADIASLAAIVNIGASLFGKSPADKERERATQENTKAIAALTKRVGDLAASSVTGSAFGGIASAVASIVGQTTTRSGGAHVHEVDGVLSAAGVTAEDLDAIAGALHITLNGTVQSFRDLDAAIKATDFAAFADTWAGILTQTETLLRVDRVTDPTQRLQAFAGAGRSSGSSIVQSILNSGDLTTAEGRAAVRAAARAWLNEFINGTATADFKNLGKLSIPEFEQFVESIISGIDDVAGSTDGLTSAADAAAAAISQLNAALSDIALLGDLVGKSADDIYKSLDAAIGLFPQFADSLAGLVKGVSFDTADGQQLFRARVSQLAAKLAANGLTPDERGVLQFLDGLLHTLPTLTTVADNTGATIDTLSGSLGGLGDAAATLADTISGIVSRVQSDGELLGHTQDQIDQDTAAALNANPDIAGLFGRIDPGNRATIEGAQTQARTVLTASATGPAADAARQVLQYVNTLLARPIFAPGEFQPLTPAGGRLGVEAQSLTQATGVRLADLTAGIRADVHDILGLMSAPRGTLPVPQIPGFGMGSGGVTNLIGPITFEIPSGMTADQGYAVGQAFAGGLADGLTPKGLTQVRDAFTRDYALSKLTTGGRVVR